MPDIPGTLIPWLTLLGLLGAGASYTWKRVLWPAFKRGVAEAIAPSLRALSEVATTELASFRTDVDGRFGSLDRRLGKLELQRSRDTQKVIEAVSPPREGT